MAADVAEKQEPLNPCCRVWRDRCVKYREKRNALHHAVKILQPEIDKYQAENLSLKKACEEERVRAKVEQEGREKELAARVLLENEISALKSEISAVQQKVGSDVQSVREVELLQICVSEAEKEIERLKQVLEKEKTRADSEKKNAEMEKKNATEAWNCVEAEKNRVGEERRRANIEGKKAEKYRFQLEALRKEADSAKSELVSEASKLEEVKKRLEAEKQRVSKEKKRADSELAKVEEHRKLAEASRKQAEEEKCRAENFCKRLEEARQRIVELEKEILDLVSRYSGKTHAGIPDKSTNAIFSKMNNGLRLDRLQRVGLESNLGLQKLEGASKRVDVDKEKAVGEKKLPDSEMVKSQVHRKLASPNREKAMEDSCSADQLSQQLEEARGRVDELQKHIHDLQSSKNPFEASAVPPDKCLNGDSGKVKLLKKQLKLEKMQVKHAKQVAKLEKGRNTILRQELGRLKLDFVQFLHHLDVLDKCFSPNAEGIGNLERAKASDCSTMQNLNLKEKLYGVEPFQMYLQSKNELPKPCCKDITASSPLRKTLQHIAPSLSLSGRICSESMSGIDSKDSKLESLLGGSSRKMLESSAINSSSASFSDRQLMGSQGRGSVTTSSKWIEESLNAQATDSSISGEVNRMRCDGKLALNAENSVRSPFRIGGTGKTIGSSRKRKRILNVIESIKLLHSEDRKLHSQIEEKLSDLCNVLNEKVNKSLEEANNTVPNLQDTSYVKNEQFSKKRKVSHQENLGIQHLCGSGEPKRIRHGHSKVHEDGRVFKQALRPANDLIRTAQACTEGISDSVISRLETMSNFEEVATGDYMKLLDLDNAADEECYRAAIEMPLSPTLPEIEFQAVETFVTNEFEPLVEERFYGGLSKEKQNLATSCGYDVINVEINSNVLKNNASKSSNNSLYYANGGPHGSSDVKVNSGNNFCIAMQEGKACDSQALDFEVGGLVSDLCRTVDEGVKFSFESEVGPAHDNIPEHFVVFHNIKDKNIISKILRATKTCMAQCSLVVQTGWILPQILFALRMGDHLLSKEKACVFFSLLLLNFSTAAWGKSTSTLNSDIVPCLDSFARHVSSVMSDAEAQSVFDKLFLDELLCVIEDFLVDGKIMTCTDVSSETLNECDSKINIHLDGVNVTLAAEAASAAQLVAGSVILASISAATDRIELLCEASYNIFRMHSCDPSLVLTILHIFAYLSGEKIFTSRKYNLTMTVLKSIITSLERGCLSVAANSFISSASEIQVKFHPYAECPFSKDAVSVEIAISLLLEKLKNYAESGTMNVLSHKEQNVLSHKEQAAQSCQDPFYLIDINCGASCLLNKCEAPAFQSNAAIDTTLCHVTDVLSLVELLACIMRWEWTCTTVVPELLRLLESPIVESFTIAIVILLSQLGRLGVAACGYDDKNVEILRDRLSAFLQQETTSRAGLPLQIATVSALLGLLSLDFEQVIQINTTMCPSIASQSAPADSIRKWFSLLSNEHQALSFSLLLSSALVPKLR